MSSEMEELKAENERLRKDRARSDQERWVRVEECLKEIMVAQSKLWEEVSLIKTESSKTSALLTGSGVETEKSIVVRMALVEQRVKIAWGAAASGVASAAYMVWNLISGGKSH